MGVLNKEQRNLLTRVVLEARTVAEEAARKALHAFGVDEADAPGHLTTDQRELRRALRAQARQLGDREDSARPGRYEVRHLGEKIAYDQWHRMLFARFLAENDLLISPDHGVGVSLQDCRELAPGMALRDGWDVAARFAAQMLPQIFRADDPAGRIELAPEDRTTLRQLVLGLPRELFLADDALGWVYQFWQAQRKEDVNASGSKIGADELSPVTQLFTEDYMVLFLLHNTLGAWWAGKVLAGIKASGGAAPGAPAGAPPHTPPGRPVSPAPSSLVCPPGAPASAGTPRGQTLAGASHVDPDRLVTEDDLRRLVALPGIEWTYLRFVRDSELASALATDTAADAAPTLPPAPAAASLADTATAEAVRSPQATTEGSGESTTPRAGSGAAGPSGGAGAAPLHSWRPAAGTFDGWPRTAKELRLLDPCMGSGHFVVFELPILVAMRMAEEGLTVGDACEAVLRDNLFGLELDPRCTQIAAFNLALAAWKLGGYRKLPQLNLACCGLAINARKEDWLKLAYSAAVGSELGPKRDLFGSEENLLTSRLREGMDRLYDLFQQAPVLGSLINPRQALGGGELFVAEFHDLAPLLEKALERETADDAAHEMAVVAQGLAKAAEILAGRFTLVATNVPYLGRGKQDDVLKDYCEKHHPDAKADLATCFVERGLVFCTPGGSIALVTPQNWLFLGTYKKLRLRLLQQVQWDAVVRLGSKGFQTPMWDFNIVLLALTAACPVAGHAFAGLDVGERKTPADKEAALRAAPMLTVGQKGQEGNPDARVTMGGTSDALMLQKVAGSYWGMGTGDFPRFGRTFWELPALSGDWAPCQSTVEQTQHYSGRELVVLWDQGTGRTLLALAEELRSIPGNSGIRPTRGSEAWGRQGLCVTLMRNLNCTLYSGHHFDGNCAAVIPPEPALLPAIWSFVSSPGFVDAVRRVDQKLNVTNLTLLKVPFDLAHWQQVAAEKYPNGLPKPHSDDPTQWLFYGHPNQAHPHGMLNRPSDSSLDPRPSTLQVAVARLLGYRWPRQTGSSFPDCPAVGPDGLEPFADADGIVCISAIKGEPPAAERLRALLAAAFGADWTAGKLSELLACLDPRPASLDDWLRNAFFEQHCQLFHHRPFIWHIWDGRKDGFSALVNYHRFCGRDEGGKLKAEGGTEEGARQTGRQILEKLTYTYLGDWISRQKAAVDAGEEGSDARLQAARELQDKLKLIIEGEAPYDIFVRWKPLDKQPTGWEPDLNDGVRLNIRPFLTVPDVGKKGAGILRWKPNINWNKDRGTDVPSAPWYPVFHGDRINDHHLPLADKRMARGV